MCLLTLIGQVSAQEPFPLPAELEPDVGFWIRVFTAVDTHHGLIHDNRHLDVVYGEISVPEGISRRQRSTLIKRVKARYRKALLALARGKGRDLSADERHVKALWAPDTRPETFRAAADRLRFQLGQSDRFRDGYIRSGHWRDHIRKALKQYRVPAGLLALPHVESSFNPKGRSHRGAAGLWQFIRSTGRRYMRVDHVVDERLDPFKATEAAARLLRHNYEITGSWPLAITAYNHGAAGVRRAVRTLGTKDIATLVRRYRGRGFGFASRNYYVAFLAALEVDRNAGKYFGPISPRRPRPVVTAAIPDYMEAAPLQERLGLGRRALQQANPALRSTVWRGDKYIPKGFQLRIECPTPDACSQLGAQVPSILAGIPTHSRQKPDLYHRVERGQTLSGIAARYGLRVGQLVALNGLSSRHRIRAGQRLRLPLPPGKTIPAVLVTGHGRSPQGSVTPAAGDGLYRVGRGDSLYTIAKRLGVTQQALLRLNSLPDKDRLYPGQLLRITAPIQAPHSARAVPGTDKALPTTSIEDTDVSEESACCVAQADASPDSPATVEALPLPPAATETSHSGLEADPSDYSVADDDTIEVQTEETLGHYADWLGLPTQRLRSMNHLEFRQPLVLGRRLKLDFSRASPQAFESKRRAYHQALQDRFFKEYRIADTRTHQVRDGESLWVLTHHRYQVPFWLFHQYNPDLDVQTLRPGTRLIFPVLERRQQDPQRPPGTNQPKVAA